MKKEQVLNLMDTVGPDLIEEADIQAPAKRRMPKAVRTGLIAACLCLALLGTAFAANPEAVADFLSRFTPVQAEPVTMPDGNDGYHVSYEPIRYPLDSFSSAILAAGDNRGDVPHVELSFDTWAEVRAFIGEDIPCFFPENGDSAGPFTVYPMYGYDNKLTRVDVFRNGYAPFVMITIETEYYPVDDTGSTGLVTTFGPDSGAGNQLELLDPYSMANGCQAEIALFAAPADPEHPDAEGIDYCIATFVQDGIGYQAIAHGSSSDEGWMARLYDTLDLFP